MFAVRQDLQALEIECVKGLEFTKIRGGAHELEFAVEIPALEVILKWFLHNKVVRALVVEGSTGEGSAEQLVELRDFDALRKCVGHVANIDKLDEFMV